MCVEWLCTSVLDLSPQSKEDVGRGLRRGCIRLKRALVGTGEEDECGLSIHAANRTCLLKGKLLPFNVCADRHTQGPPREGQGKVSHVHCII